LIRFHLPTTGVATKSNKLVQGPYGIAETGGLLCRLPGLFNKYCCYPVSIPGFTHAWE